MKVTEQRGERSQQEAAKKKELDKRISGERSKRRSTQTNHKERKENGLMGKH